MKRIAIVALFIVSLAAFACSKQPNQTANTATDDSMTTGPSSNTATSAPSTPTDTTYTQPSATTGTPVSATGT